MRYRLTQVERAQRTIRRDDRRQALTAKVDSLREWRQERAKAAKERAKEQRIERNAQPRGVDRAPRFQFDTYAEVETPELGTSIIRGRPVTANYETRRAMGARGHRRKPRRREMPGAVQRRLERNRKAAQSLWA